MKSLYFAVTLAMVGTLSLALLAFLAISSGIEKHFLEPVFEAMDELQLEQAREALERGGAPAVATYMHRLNDLFGVEHYLLDSRGFDVSSRENRSQLLPAAPEGKSRGYVSKRLVITHRSQDGRFWFVAVDPRQPNRWTMFPYYVLVLGVAALLCWLAAIGVITPLRRVTKVLQRFGHGDLSVRLRSSRQDEIGELSRSFDLMAEHLQSLLASERQLLEDISHELRSPLARLRFAVRLAKTSTDQAAAFSRIEREVTRITSLVSEIVELTRTEGDPNGRRREPMDVDKVLSEVVADGRVEASFRGCMVEVSGLTHSHLDGYGELLRRAVENVLRNAIRYAPQGSIIDVTISETAQWLRIVISDSGPGVPEESLSRIFEPFFRLETARDSESGGVGLGLAIAKRAILLHGGTIHAQNAHPGLAVSIALPLSGGDKQLNESDTQARLC